MVYCRTIFVAAKIKKSAKHSKQWRKKTVNVRQCYVKLSQIEKCVKIFHYSSMNFISHNLEFFLAVFLYANCRFMTLFRTEVQSEVAIRECWLRNSRMSFLPAKNIAFSTSIFYYFWYALIFTIKSHNKETRCSCVLIESVCCSLSDCGNFARIIYQLCIFKAINAHFKIVLQFK